MVYTLRFCQIRHRRRAMVIAVMTAGACLLLHHYLHQDHVSISYRRHYAPEAVARPNHQRLGTQEPGNATKRTSEWAAAERDMAARAARYRNVCSAMTQQPRRTTGHRLYYIPNNIHFCSVEKAGCTFWKRVFFFLYGNYQNKEGVKSPYDIPRYSVHHGKTLRKPKLNRTTFDHMIKFMFTRDPYARLWSFYVDKLYLPDSWPDIGRHIMKSRGPEHQKQCADDVSFDEFLKYVVNGSRNTHWNPIFTVCNPCGYKPHYVGKMETYSRDSRFILKKAGLDHLIEGHGSKTHAEDEIRTLTDSMFRIYLHRRKKMQRCLSLVDLTQRTWQAFVYNGYIDGKLTFPRQEVSNKMQNASDIMKAYVIAKDILIQALRQSPSRTSHELREYRRGVLVKQFRAVSPGLLEKLVKYYAVDFAMFDYEPRPADIFANMSG